MARTCDLDHREMPSMRRRLCAALCAGALAISAAMPSVAAYAVDASVDGNSGSGSTDITIQLKQGATEMSGTDDDNNPDTNPHDGYGDNIAFSVPMSINFVSDSQGVLTGPSAGAAFIKNESIFDIHTSSAKITAESGWNLVDNASESDKADALDFQIGPSGDMLDAVSYQAKKAVGDKAKWHMVSKKSSGTADRVVLGTQGRMNNVDKDLKKKTKVATINWYVTPGVGASS